MQKNLKSISVFHIFFLLSQHAGAAGSRTRHTAPSIASTPRPAPALSWHPSATPPTDSGKSPTPPPFYSGWPARRRSVEPTALPPTAGRHNCSPSTTAARVPLGATETTVASSAVLPPAPVTVFPCPTASWTARVTRKWTVVLGDRCRWHHLLIPPIRRWSKWVRPFPWPLRHRVLQRTAAWMGQWSDGAVMAM